MDGKINRRVLDIATPIFAQAEKDRPDVSFRIRVIDSPELNAFSIPAAMSTSIGACTTRSARMTTRWACVIATSRRTSSAATW